MLSFVFIMVPQGIVAAERINEVLEQENVQTFVEEDFGLNRIETVEFRDVSFRYEGAEKEIRRHHDDERVEDGEREADEDLPEALSRERKEAVDTKKKADQKQIHRHHLIVYVSGKLCRVNGQHRLQSQINRQRRQEQHPG